MADRFVGLSVWSPDGANPAYIGDRDQHAQLRERGFALIYKEDLKPQREARDLAKELVEQVDVCNIDALF